MRTPQWIKKLGRHAGELYVAAELPKRGIPNSLLPEDFSDDDIIVGTKDGSNIAYIQVKSCHPDRDSSFILRETNEEWGNAPNNQFVAFVWSDSPSGVRSLPSLNTSVSGIEQKGGLFTISYFGLTAGSVEVRSIRNQVGQKSPTAK